MLRNTIAIILLFAFTVQSFSKVFLVVNYYANTTSFLKNCVNRSVPQLNCNGQCVLMKKIQAEQHKEQNNPELKLENKSEVYVLSASAIIYPQQTSSLIVYLQVKSIGYTTDYTSVIFRPPVS